MMEKEVDFYKNPQPGIMDDGENGLVLQFSAYGRNVSDYQLDRSDILFLRKQFDDWLKNYPIDSDKLSDEEVKESLETRLMTLRFSVGSSRIARILRELAEKWDD